VIPGTTTFLRQFFPEFKADEVAEKCVGKEKYAGLDAEQIKALWKQEALRGMSEGTNVHAYAEYKYNPELPRPEPISERCERLFLAVDNAVKRLDKWFEFVAAEKIVFSTDLDIAGIIDLLMRDRENGEIVILDWKQNKQINTDNPWQKALEPISHLDDCDLVKYNLQLAVYKKILVHERYFDWATPGYRMGLIHLLPGGQMVNIKLDNMDKEVDRLFEHTKNNQLCLF